MKHRTAPSRPPDAVRPGTGPPAAKRPEAEDEDPPGSKLHGKLQLVYLALKVVEVAAALLRGCL